MTRIGSSLRTSKCLDLCSIPLRSFFRFQDDEQAIQMANDPSAMPLIGQFLDWCQRSGFRGLEDFEPITVTAYVNNTRARRQLCLGSKGHRHVEQRQEAGTSQSPGCHGRHQLHQEERLTQGGPRTDGQLGVASPMEMKMKTEAKSAIFIIGGTGYIGDRSST